MPQNPCLESVKGAISVKWGNLSLQGNSFRGPFPSLLFARLLRRSQQSNEIFRLNPLKLNTGWMFFPLNALCLFSFSLPLYTSVWRTDGWIVPCCRLMLLRRCSACLCTPRALLPMIFARQDTPLSVFVTQSDVHSTHLSPVPLSLPRPSLQAIKSTRRRQQWSPARDRSVSVVRQQVVSRQREPQSKRLRALALPCRSVNDPNVNAKPSQAEKARVCVCVQRSRRTFCYVPLKRLLRLSARDERCGTPGSRL